MIIMLIQDAFNMIRALRRDIRWHDSRRASVASGAIGVELIGYSTLTTFKD